MAKNPFQRQQKIQAEAKAPEKRQNRYQQLYNLKANPFPQLALFTPTTDDPRRNGEIYDQAFREEEEKRFFKLFVQPPAGDQPTELGFIRLDPQAGGRGNGKSAFLHHIMSRINNQGWAEDLPTDPDSADLFALAVHILPEPKRQRRFWQFIHLIFETCASEELFAEIDEQFRAAILSGLLTDDQFDDLATRPSEEVSGKLQSDQGFRELLSEFDLTQRRFQEEAEIRLREVSTSLIEGKNGFLPEFTSANCSLTNLWDKWQQEGVVGNAYRWRNVGHRWFIDGLISVIIIAGYSRFYILLDEFEKIYISQNTREREEFLDSLRQYFYERDSAVVRYQFVSTVLTIHPSIDRFLAGPWSRVGLENLAPLDPARINQRSVVLGPSTPDKLSHLLVTFIDHFRPEEDENQGTLYPFVDGALDPAMEAARFYPRGTLWYAQAIIQKAAIEDVSPPITRHFVEEFINAGNAPPEDTDDPISSMPSAAVDLQG